MAQVDPLLLLSCAIGTGYLKPAEVPATAIWPLLSADAQAVFTESCRRGDPDSAVARRLSDLRRARGLLRDDLSGLQTRLAARLMLGLLYLKYQRNVIETEELLRRAMFIVNTYICGIDPSAFRRLFRKWAGGTASIQGRTEVEIALQRLFRPYADPAMRSLMRWKLSGVGADAGWSCRPVD